jgi:predicted ATPase
MAFVKEVTIRGFRTLKDATWKPGRLNVVIGQNGSGKSNLLWALKLLQESARGRLRDSILAEGGFGQLLWNHEAPELAWSLTLGISLPGSHSYQLTYELLLQPQGYQGDFNVARELLTESADRKPCTLLVRDAQHMELWDGQKLAPIPSKAVEVPGRAPGPPVPVQETLLSSTWGTGSGAEVCCWLLRLFGIYHDMVTHRGAKVREAVVTRVENVLDSDGQNLAAALHTLYTNSRDFKRTLDDAMRAAFGKEFESLAFPPAADQKVQLAVQWRSLKKPVSAAYLSDGTLRFLMLAAVLANSEAPRAILPLIAIDEPETGLHPGMFRIIAELAAEAAKRATVVFTTHSAEFLNAFSADQAPTVTVAELIDGQTHLRVKDGDELKRWLKDFRLGQMMVSGDLEALP